LIQPNTGFRAIGDAPAEIIVLIEIPHLTLRKLLQLRLSKIEQSVNFADL
jgi:hypothetical protein